MAEDRRNSGMTDQWEVYVDLACTCTLSPCVAHSACYLLVSLIDLFFNPEIRGSTMFQNIGKVSQDLSIVTTAKITFVSNIFQHNVY